MKRAYCREKKTHLSFRMHPHLDVPTTNQHRLQLNISYQRYIIHIHLDASKHLHGIRDIHKVRKRQHQYPEFGHTQGEIQKTTCN
jgi:hypothetical protein